MREGPGRDASAGGVDRESAKFQKTAKCSVDCRPERLQCRASPAEASVEKPKHGGISNLER